MNHSIANIRNEYCLKGLHESELDLDPIKQFRNWFEEAVDSGIDEPNAMHLSTVSLSRPTGRIVLLKDLDNDGFVFFTNYDSRKGQEMETNPQVALTFFWKELERQVRIEGTVIKTTLSESDSYFASRPRGSQIGAWVSSQSTVIESREVLETELKVIEDKFEGIQVARPDYWGGFRVIPDYVEFWQGRPSRLHDRLAFEKMKDGTWTINRLSP